MLRVFQDRTTGLLMLIFLLGNWLNLMMRAIRRARLSFFNPDQLMDQEECSIAQTLINNCGRDGRPYFKTSERRHLPTSHYLDAGGDNEIRPQLCTSGIRRLPKPLLLLRQHNARG